MSIEELREYFVWFKEHLGEAGWYIYLSPKDPRCRVILHGGPFPRRSQAETIANKLNEEMST